MEVRADSNEKKRLDDGLTALLDRRAPLRKLDKNDVAEAFLRKVRDGHRSDAGLVVKLDHLVFSRVEFRWVSSLAPSSGEANDFRQ